MDRAAIEKDLAMVEGHVTLGLRHIARQVEIVARFEGQGHTEALKEATRLLTNFKEMQAAHESHRARLLSELEKAK